MTDLELIALFAGSWTAAAAIWMLLDWAARPKHARFRPKGDRVHRGPLSYQHFRRVRRAEENEEVRLRIQQRYGRPTLAMRSKRQQQVVARHDRLVSGIGETVAPNVLTPALSNGMTESNAGSTVESAESEVTEPVFWNELRDKAMGFDAENDKRLSNGEAPTRYNPVLHTDEAMTFDGTTASWPSHTIDPFENTDPFETSAPIERGVENDVYDSDTDAASQAASTDENDSAIERAVRDLEHLPEAG